MVTKKFKFLYKMIKADKSASNSLNPSIFEGLVTLCAPDAVCFSRHVPHASGRIRAERFYVIGTLRSNFLLHKKECKSCAKLSGSALFFIFKTLFNNHSCLSVTEQCNLDQENHSKDQLLKLCRHHQHDQSTG